MSPRAIGLASPTCILLGPAQVEFLWVLGDLVGCFGFVDAEGRGRGAEQATVGAGLPVIATLKHLIDTGDRILKVEGIFSGTLSYIFNSLAPGRRFSEVVAEAKALGYTEPDPRDDLAGMDVARKVTILARCLLPAFPTFHSPPQSLPSLPSSLSPPHNPRLPAPPCLRQPCLA